MVRCFALPIPKSLIKNFSIIATVGPFDASNVKSGGIDTPTIKKFPNIKKRI